MNDELTVGSIVLAGDDYKIMTNNGLASMVGPAVTGSISAVVNGGTSSVSIRSTFDIDDFLDEHIMNRVTVSHKVQEQELMKLKEHAPDYANEIKDNIAKNCARDMVKKLTFTKKHDKDADVHHFIGRVWMFTEDELKNLINEARNA